MKNIKDQVIALSEGNPGVIVACFDILDKCRYIDPDFYKEIQYGLGPIEDLERNEITGEKIWMIYKDICLEDARYMLGLIRAIELCILSKRKITLTLEGKSKIDLDEMISKVKEYVPNFI